MKSPTLSLRFPWKMVTPGCWIERENGIFGDSFGDLDSGSGIDGGGSRSGSICRGVDGDGSGSGEICNGVDDGGRSSGSTCGNGVDDGGRSSGEIYNGVDDGDRSSGSMCGNGVDDGGRSSGEICNGVDDGGRSSGSTCGNGVDDGGGCSGTGIDSFDLAMVLRTGDDTNLFQPCLGRTADSVGFIALRASEKSCCVAGSMDRSANGVNKLSKSITSKMSGEESWRSGKSASGKKWRNILSCQKRPILLRK